MQRKLLFIFNPHSGKGKVRQALFDIVDIFTKANYDVTVYPTQTRGDGKRKITESAADYDIIVVSGGDGTLSESVSGMLEISPDKRVPIGYIPAGTMNDFASGNGIPKEMADAAAEIVRGDMVNYDIGRFNDRTFIYVAGFGLFTDVSYDTPQNVKNFFGNAAYIWEGIKRIPKIETVRTRVTTDEGEVFEGDVYWCLMLNSSSVAGIGFGDFYDIDADDGLFELILVQKSMGLTAVPNIINDIKSGRRDAEGIKVISTKGALIETGKPVRWTLDGEFGGEESRVWLKVLHNAVKFVFDPKASSNIKSPETRQ